MRRPGARRSRAARRFLARLEDGPMGDVLGVACLAILLIAALYLPEVLS